MYALMTGFEKQIVLLSGTSKNGGGQVDLKALVPRTSSAKSTGSSIDQWPINPDKHEDVWTSRYLGYLSPGQADFFCNFEISVPGIFTME